MLGESFLEAREAVPSQPVDVDGERFQVGRKEEQLAGTQASLKPVEVEELIESFQTEEQLFVGGKAWWGDRCWVDLTTRPKCEQRHRDRCRAAQTSTNGARSDSILFAYEPPR